MRRYGQLIGLLALVCFTACEGTSFQSSVPAYPVRVVINTSEDGKSQPVLVENFTKIRWEVGKYYRIYADAASSYSSMPWLNARYTYTK